MKLKFLNLNCQHSLQSLLIIQNYSELVRKVLSFFTIYLRSGASVAITVTVNRVITTICYIVHHDGYSFVGNELAVLVLGKLLILTRSICYESSNTDHVEADLCSLHESRTHKEVIEDAGKLANWLFSQTLFGPGHVISFLKTSGRSELASCRCPWDATRLGA